MACTGANGCQNHASSFSFLQVATTLAEKRTAYFDWIGAYHIEHGQIVFVALWLTVAVEDINENLFEETDLHTKKVSVVRLTGSKRNIKDLKRQASRGGANRASSESFVSSPAL